MRVISRRALTEFWSIHSDAKGPLTAWFKIVERSRFTDFNALRRAFGSADYVPPLTVFDVGGNRFRIVTVIHYNTGRIYVRHVFTHAQYDRWSKGARGSRGRR